VAKKKKGFNLDTLEKYKFEISRELGIVDQTNLEAPDKFNPTSSKTTPAPREETPSTTPS